MATKQWMPRVFLALGFGMMIAGCGESSADAADLSLETSTVTRGTLESSVEATGTVEPVRRVEVRSQASGEILRMPVELGDDVERGDLLLEIDPRDEVNELEQAQADLEQAEAQLQVAESRLERIQSLRDSGVVTAEELETAVVNHANARSAHVRAETSLRLAQDQRADATVEAPISGTIIEKGVEEGQVVTGTRDLTGGTVLLQIADLSTVQVRTLVDESEIGGIRPGMQATLTVEAHPQETFRGEVLQVEPQATEQDNVTMFAVMTQIPNEEGLLRPGMNANVEIVLGQRDDVLMLSNSGVKLPEEARQLVQALGMDPDLLDQRVASGADEASGPEAAPGDGEITPAELASMSREERRELFESMDAAERRQLMARAGGGAGGGAPAADRRNADPSAPRPAFVFMYDDEGMLTLRPVQVGMSSWEDTEIVEGLSEGDTVVNVPLALVQQSEMLERFRGRGGIPGMGGG